MKRITFVVLSIALFVQEIHAQNETLYIATYNLRFHTESDSINAWPNRKEQVKSLIRFHEFDIIGTQEGLIEQIEDLAELSEFSYTGKGRGDGKRKGEHSAIFYRKNRLELLDHGDFWLSETPDVPSLGWDATCCNRICSWGLFKDLITNKEFYFFSAHFDHQGVKARDESAKLLVSKIKAIAKNKPVISVGDFNATPLSEPIQTMKSYLSDAYDITATPPYGPEGTTNGFRLDSRRARRIDFVFVSNQISVHKYGVLTDMLEQRYPSDHFPVAVKITIGD